MKCYLASNKNGDWQQIVFAESRYKAICKSDGYQDDGDYMYARATREKQYDQYIELGYVPKQVLMNDGWWFECSGFKQNQKRRCCDHVTQDDIYKIVDEKVYCEECSKSLSEVVAS